MHWVCLRFRQGPYPLKHFRAWCRGLNIGLLTGRISTCHLKIRRRSQLHMAGSGGQYQAVTLRDIKSFPVRPADLQCRLATPRTSCAPLW